MRPFTWQDAASVDEAKALLAAKGVLPIAGGVDLLGELKDGIRSPERVVNLLSIPGLSAIEDKGDAWRIGATVLLADLASHDGIRRDLSGLAEAALAVATPQIRNQGTFGGNLAQRPRCWYYRHPDFTCEKKSGKGCPAKEGENRYLAVMGTEGPCVIAHPSDCAPMLVALEATIRLAGPAGERSVAAAKFWQMPAENMRLECDLKDGEFITGADVPKARRRSTYVKVRERDSFDFALVACAIAGNVDGGKMSDARVVLGGVAPIPWACPSAEANLAKNTLADAVEPASKSAADGAKPLSQTGYKVPLIHAAVAQAIRKFI
jgi:xanthine dehydrogenase YagS FAD-binding subunit